MKPTSWAPAQETIGGPTAPAGETKTSAWPPPSSALLSPERPGNGRAECSDRRSGRNGRALYRWSRRLRLCSAIQSARASASATVPIASTSTASCSPKIKVDVIGSKPSGFAEGLWPLADHSLSRGGKNVHASVFDATARQLGPVFCRPFGTPFNVGAGDCSSATLAEARRRIHWTNVSIHTKVLVGRRGQERASLYPNGRSSICGGGNAMKKMTAPIPFAGELSSGALYASLAVRIHEFGTPRAYLQRLLSRQKLLLL